MGDIPQRRHRRRHLGDVAAESVLLDRDANAWIIDFDFLYTKGWVDKEFAGTVENDLGGMAKLRGSIRTGQRLFGEARVVWSVQTENP